LRYTYRPYVIMGLLGLCQATADAETITLADAVARAQRNHPDIALAEGELAADAGRVEAAGLPAHNPELSLGAGLARGGGTFFDWQIGLSQTVELGGKRARRVDASSARRDATRVRVAQQRFLITVEVGRAFRSALIARERVAAASESARIADEVDAAVHARQAAGGGTQLEANVAIANRGRARRDAVEAGRAYDAARVALDAVVCARAGSRLEPDGAVPLFPAPPWTEDQVAAIALRDRPDIAIARQERVAARADVELADATATPDVNLGAAYARNEGTNVYLGTVSIPLPVRNRNQGERRVARAELHKAEIGERAIATQVEREVRAAYRSYVAARAAVEAFDREVIGKLDENLALAGRSFTSGKISLVEVNVLRRELIEARNAYLDALTEAVEARAAIERSVGAVLE